ncbi:MAG: sigma 54-interacting transcriptional regulator [Desulfovibrionaceae bacterium]
MDRPGTEYLDTIKRVLDNLSAQTPLEEGLKNLLQTLARDQGYVRAFLAIMDPESENLRLSLTHSPAKNDQVTYSPGQGVIGQVYESGRSAVVPQMSENHEFLNKAFGRSEEELKSLSFISVPVINRSQENREVLGTISADLPIMPREVLEDHRRLLEVVAAMIANHVARLQEEMALHKHLLTQGMSGQDSPPPSNFVAASKPMRMVLRQARQVAPSRATVLLRGESGTGKELLAEFLHSGSPRSDKPLIKLNCAALPAELVESELFGYQKGAFTGAYQNKRGLFEVANNGTLFLDEIGELSLDAQAKVLRAIQEKEITRVGGEQPITVDVRLITATHQPLEELLTEGRFREDLYYRINVFPVFIPPLRERREDILPLAEHFLADFAGEYGKQIKRISTPAIELLTLYHWPGNVRELRNCVERAVLVCEEEVIRTYHLPPTLQTAESSATETNLSFGEAVAKFEQELLVDALKKSRGNMLQAARELRVSYRIVNYKVKKYGLDNKRFSTGKPKKKK